MVVRTAYLAELATIKHIRLEQVDVKKNIRSTNLLL